MLKLVPQCCDWVGTFNLNLRPSRWEDHNTRVHILYWSHWTCPIWRANMPSWFWTSYGSFCPLYSSGISYPQYSAVIGCALSIWIWGLVGGKTIIHMSAFCTGHIGHVQFEGRTCLVSFGPLTVVFVLPTVLVSPILSSIDVWYDISAFVQAQACTAGWYWYISSSWIWTPITNITAWTQEQVDHFTTY
jgi:hypothetical protein